MHERLARGAIHDRVSVVRLMEESLRSRYPYADESRIISVAGQMVDLAEKLRSGKIDQTQHDLMEGNLRSVVSDSNSIGFGLTVSQRDRTVDGSGRYRGLLLRP